MAFKKNSPGCPCCTVPWTFNIKGCAGTGIAGALIELRQSGVLIDSCTTGDGTSGTILGRCVMSVPAGTYDITIAGPSGTGFAVNTSTTSISAAATSNITLTAAAGYHCVACCNYPVPDTLTTSDGLGTHTLTLSFYNSTTKAASWTATADAGVPGYQFNPSTGLCETPGNATALYSLNCGSGGGWSFFVSVPVQCCEGDVSRYGIGTGVGSVASSSSPTGTCHPFDLTFNIPATVTPNTCGFAAPVALPTPGGGGPMEVTP